MTCLGARRRGAAAGPLRPRRWGVLGCTEAGSHGEASPWPWGFSGRDPGTGALVGRGACVHGGLGAWVLLGVSGGGEAPEEDACGGGWGYRNDLGQVFKTFKGEKCPCVDGREGLAALGSPTPPQREKSSAGRDLTGAPSPPGHSGSNSPAHPLPSRGGVGCGSVGLCQSPAP